MMSILRSEFTRCVWPIVKDARIPRKLLQRGCNLSILGKNFRVTPFRFVQSKPNNEGKAKSFNYAPGMSPAEFKNSRKPPKQPFYTQMTSGRGQVGEYADNKLIAALFLAVFYAI